MYKTILFIDKQKVSILCTKQTLKLRKRLFWIKKNKLYIIKTFTKKMQIFSDENNCTIWVLKYYFPAFMYALTFLNVIHSQLIILISKRCIITRSYCAIDRQFFPMTFLSLTFSLWYSCPVLKLCGTCLLKIPNDHSW